MRVQEFLTHLSGVQRHGSGWKALCPAHDDHDPSLDIDEGDDGRVLLICRSNGCDAQAIVAGVGLTMADLFPDSSTNRRGRIVATYDYRDADGELLYQVCRREPGRNGRSKEFPQRRPDGAGGWAWGVRGVQRVLYRLPETIEAVQAGRTIYIPEGEKHVDALIERGLAATCNVGGAGKWRREDNRHLRGADVIVLPDNDEPGRAHAREVAASLYGTAAQVRVVELPGLDEKGDVLDWLDAGGTSDELERLTAEGREWTPELAEPESTAPQIRTMREVLETAGQESLPTPRVPRLAYAGRAVLFAGREKSGKSTLLSAGIATASRGDLFLSEPCRPASALWLTAEEREDDVARRLEGFGADPDRVWIVAAPKLPHVLNDLRAGVERLRPDVVVVDTLASLVRLLPRDERPSPGDSAAWTPVVLSLVELAHQLDAAVVIVGHASKATGEYRDSTAIGASVDGILEMKDGRAGNERKVTARGRWPMEDFAVRLVDGRFELADGNLPPTCRHSRSNVKSFFRVQRFHKACAPQSYGPQEC